MDDSSKSTQVYAMTVIVSYALLIFVVSSCTGTDKGDVNMDPTQEMPVAESPITTEWLMIFEDDFDDPNLPEWNVWNSGAFNQEIQLYRPEQLDVQNGIMTINVQRNTVVGDTDPFNTTQKTFEYVSGRLETKKQFGPSAIEGERELRYMARIKMPPGNGMWPAFWSYGDMWPTNGEIDLIEARGNEPTRFSSNIFYGTQPGIPLTNNDANTLTEYDLELDITTDFHVYELIWTADSLSIIFDGELLKKYEATPLNFINELFGKKHQIVLNTAVGGVFFPPNANSSNFADTSEMQIDWVRVYQR